MSMPVIRLSRQVINELDTYKAKAKGEFSVVGMVEEERTPSGQLELSVNEIFLPEQANTSAYTDIDDTALLAVMGEISKRGDDAVSKLRCWIHSHGTMPVFWSGTDTGTISKWAPNEGGTPSYLISMVVNKADLFKLRLDVFTPPTEYGPGGVETYDDLVYETFDNGPDGSFVPYYTEYLGSATETEEEPLFTDKQEEEFSCCLEEVATETKSRLLEKMGGILGVSTDDVQVRMEQSGVNNVLDLLTVTEEEVS